MPLALVTFHDGELLYAETPEVTFDLPVLEAEIRNVDSNSERALLPLTAIRQVIVGDVLTAPDEAEVSAWDRAAFHFTDGQVLRAWIAPDVTLGRYGGVWRIVEPGSDELRTVAIPYSSLKGVFQLRQWDSRSPAERAARAAGIPIHLDQTVRALAEREVRTVRGRTRPSEGRLIDRVRRAEHAGDDG